MSFRRILLTSVAPLRISLAHPSTSRVLCRTYGTEFTDLLANAKKESHPGVDDCDICQDHTRPSWLQQWKNFFESDHSHDYDRFMARLRLGDSFDRPATHEDIPNKQGLSQ